MRRWRIALAIIGVGAVALWANNSSLFAPAPQGRPMILAHRGIAQQFDRTDVGRDTCTATRMRPSGHSFIENTLPSMREAARLGADMIEIDVAPASDGEIALFHDWTLECRTDGEGPVRARTMAELKRLDVGYGYTADGGRTYPLRGTGVGQIPTLGEALAAFPRQPFLINFKSKDASEADAVAAVFARAGVPIDSRYAFYGRGGAVARMRRLVPRSWVFDLGEAKACSIAYFTWGWSGRVPEVCRGGTIAVPIGYRRLVWGWPDRFLQRMKAAQVRVVIFGDGGIKGAVAGLASREELDAVPDGFDGVLWVEDLHALAPHLRERAWTARPLSR